jgi:hypothetical protein
VPPFPVPARPFVPQRYCKDNPGRFRNADAAYTLAFAIIMLNTDAHNPHAERRLAAPDFVAMNFGQTDSGASALGERQRAAGQLAAGIPLP